MAGRPDIQPRMLTLTQVLAYLGKSETWLREQIDRWERNGVAFPKKHPLLNAYDIREIDDWVDITSGRKVSMGYFTRQLEEKSRHGKH